MRSVTYLATACSLSLLACQGPIPSPPTPTGATSPSEAWREDEAYLQAVAIARAGAPSLTPELDALAAQAAVTTPELGLDELVGPVDLQQPPAQLRSGDLVRVEVYGRPEFTGTRRVGPNGHIPLFLSSSLEVEGLTEEGARDLVREALLEYAKLPAVQLWLLDRAPVQVQVTGQVHAPGSIELPLGRPLDVLDLLATAGGLLPDADDERLTLLRREGGSLRCYHFTHRELLAARAAGSAAWVQPEDQLLVPRLPDAYVYGQVVEQGARSLRPGATVASLLQSAGGLSEHANARVIQILRGDQVQPTDLDRVVQPREVVYVPQRQRVYLVGEGVTTQGPVDLPGGGLTVVQAIAEGGWLTKHADTDGVEILRHRAGRQERIPVPLAEILAGELREDEFSLEPGDLIYVPETIW
jgi:polysaccharide biosynthesis/export protein